jgi:hypothetical protein
MARSQINADWIPVRLDLAQNPKVLQMVSKLSKTIGVYVLAVSPDDLLSGVTRRGTCPVTELVTCHALSDVTICALVRVWGAANTFMRDGVIHNASLDWVDGVAKIPAFGKAMESVGWVQVTPEGLLFPNFDKLNRPKTNDLRSIDAKRKAAQRLRHWLDNHDESHADYSDKVAEMSRLNVQDKYRTSHALLYSTGQYINEGESTAPARPAGCPATEAAAIQIAESAGVPADYAVTLWNELEGIGWVNFQGQPVKSFAHFVKSSFNRSQNRQIGAKKPVAGAVESGTTRNAAYAQWMQAKTEAAGIKNKSFTTETDRMAAQTRLSVVLRQITELETTWNFTK